MQATDVDGSLEKWLVETRCKSAKLGDAIRGGAAPAAKDRSPFGDAPVLAAVELNAKQVADYRRSSGSKLSLQGIVVVIGDRCHDGNGAGNFSGRKFCYSATR